MRRLLGHGMALMVVVVLSAAASAEPLTFDFRQAPRVQFPFFNYSETFETSPGTFATWNLLVTASSTGPGGLANVHRNRRGHGVISEVGDNRQVDGRGFDERLNLDFDTPFQLDIFELERVTRNDDIWIWIDGVQIYRGKIVDLPGGFLHETGPRRDRQIYEVKLHELIPLGDRTGLLSQFGARHNNDNWRLASVSQTPEPGSLALCGLTAAIAWRRRRKKARSAA